MKFTKKAKNDLPAMKREFKGTIEDVEELFFYGHSIKDVCILLRKDLKSLQNLAEETRGIPLEELLEIGRKAFQYYIRRLQLYHAQKSFQMAAFLGKNNLGQRDNPVQLPEFSGELIKVVDKLSENLDKYGNRSES